MDELTAAVVETARSAADLWDQPPRLYALARRSDLDDLEDRMPARAKDAPAGTLIPIAQDHLPNGDPAKVLARIHWPPIVPGCVLVTEVRIALPGAGDQSPEEYQGRQARLCVGVLRETDQAAQHACCLQQRGVDELIVGPDLADDLVTALLGTLSES
jgi:hypothetical protein